MSNLTPDQQTMSATWQQQPVGLRCTICNHPARPQIDLAIATGLSKRAVAERFGVSRDAVWRHAQAHLTAEMRAGPERHAAGDPRPRPK